MKKEIRVAVVGLSHYMDDYDEFCRNLVKDSYVFVRHEPGNKFDRNALLVNMPDGRQVGYISGKCSHQVHAGIGERTVLAKVIGGEWKSFDVRMMVDSDAYDSATISTETGEICSQLPESVIGLRNVLPTLYADNMLEQAWSMIETGDETGDQELISEGVTLFARFYGSSLCAEDEMRVKWIIDHKLDKDGVIFDRVKKMTAKPFLYDSLLTQMNNLMNIDKVVMDDFRQRFSEACTGESAVRSWLDTALEGQIKGCYNGLTVEMACIIFYHKLSRMDIYILFSHIIAITKVEREKVEEKEAERSESGQLKEKLISRLTRLTPYLYNMDKDVFETKLNEMLDIYRQDQYTDARRALWNLFTKHFPRDNKDEGIDRIVTMNLVGKIKKNGYFIDNDDFLARLSYDSGNFESDGNNIGRAFEAQRYTTEINKLVEYYFP